MPSRKLRYKGVSVNLIGMPDLGKTKRVRSLYLKSFDSMNGGKPKNLLVIYDIPEGRKKERDWFRRQLINLDFIMIQRSVWVGPSPLPNDFLKYVENIKIRSNFKTFKLAKAYEI